jgi:para-nitrobenzyl esterase
MILHKTRAFIVIALAFLSGPAFATDAPIVQTKSGPVEGAVDGGVLSFKGIPYAAPPVGPLRWRAPQRVASWTGTRPATSFGSVCMQPIRGNRAKDFADQSEDCLFLNVYRPATKAKSMPVLFWIPGGGLVTGSGSEPVYDGKALAERGVILVTINYRLGRFGFFAHPELTKANPDGGRIYNYGLMDQIAALNWVHDNIAALGGDPGNVTIFGESAGGASVDALMISPPARRLFAAAIVESGYGRGNYPRVGQATKDGKPPVEQTGLDLAKALNMPNATLDQLRAVPAGDVVTAYRNINSASFIFAIDGVTVLSDLFPAFQAKQEAPVPLIIGSNDYEFGFNPPGGKEAAMAKAMPADKRPALVPAYGGEKTFEDYIVTDVTFASQARALALRHDANGYPTYVYRFSVAPKDSSVPGAVHASEIPYVFGNLTGNHLALKTPPDADDKRASNDMMRYWTDMAKTHNPNAKGLPEWPSYKGGDIIDIGRDATRAEVDPLATRLDAVNAVADLAAQ